MLVQRAKIIQSLIREFNYNPRLDFIILGVIISLVGVAEFSEVFTHEDIYNGYNHFVSQTIEPNCSWDHLPYQRGGINWYLVCVSYMTFDNSRIIPFFVSVGLIPMTWLFIRAWSNNMTAFFGTVGLVLNPVFLIFDSSSAYSQTWALIFISSLYFMKKNSLGMVASFNLSMFCKAIPFAWAPFIIWLTLKSNTRRQSKIIIAGGIGVMTLIVLTMSLVDGGTQAYGMFAPKPLSYQSILDTISWTLTAYRWNEELLVATPIIFALYFLKRTSWVLSKFPFQMLAISWLAFFGITLFTVEGYFPYRIIPNIIMFLFAASSLLYGYLAKNVFKSLGIQKPSDKKSLG